MYLHISVEQDSIKNCSASFYRVAFLIFAYMYAATPNPPVITRMTSLSTSISLNWTQDKTCFESVPLEYHIVVNIDTQRIITGEMGTVISVVSGRAYTVSVMAVVDDSQRSEPDREIITAGGCRG